MPKFATVEAYLAAVPPDARAALDAVREAIAAATPGSVERVSYDILGRSIEGRGFVGVGAWKRHISIYPIPGGDAELERRLAKYVNGRGTLRFPLAEPMPLDLIAEVAAALYAMARARRT